MEVQTSKFNQTASRTLADQRLQNAHEVVYNGFHRARIKAASDTQEWEQQRTLGKAIKDHTIANLDYYLDMLASNVEKNGGKVFFAQDAQDANRYVLSVAQKNHVNTVIKSKSMVSEEMGLNHVLEGQGMEVVETDLGEYIIQLAGETPYHIIAPAIHKSIDQVANLLEKKGDRDDSHLVNQSQATNPQETPEERQARAEALTRKARQQLRDVFQRADMSVTGVNFAVAETGSIALVTNEGNGRMATSMPRIHIAAMGMEKVIPSAADLSVMLRILIRSATGQRISSYVTMVNGPRQPDEEDGPEEFHLIIMNNGRDRLLRDHSLREALNCIRCGACMNACPVYRKVGGHSYGWVYPGPIGAIVSPVLTGLREGSELPAASSLCGACHEACPVKINIPRMLLELRAKTAEPEPTDDSGSSASLVERITWKGWRNAMMGRGRFQAAAKVGRWIMKPVSRQGWVRKAPPPVSAWTRSRDFPAPAKQSFGERFAKRNRDKS